MIQIPAFFDRIPEVNIKNSNQKVVDLIQECDFSRELTAHMSSDFVQTTTNFLKEASQLIESGYEQTPAVLEKLKAIDKEYDIPFKNLKNNIMEFTQDLSTRTETTVSKPPSTKKDSQRIEIDEHDKRKKTPRKGAKSRAPENAEDGEDVISYVKHREGKKALRLGNMEEEEELKAEARVDEEHRRYYRGYISEEEDPEASIFDEEFGKPIDRASPMPATRTNNARTAKKSPRKGDDDEDEEFILTEKKPTKRKAPASKTVEVAASQGKRVRADTSKGKGGKSSASKKFL